MSFRVLGGSDDFGRNGVFPIFGSRLFAACFWQGGPFPLFLAGAAKVLPGCQCPPRACPARCGPGALCSFFESKFKPLKTPPSHGSRGLAAIKAIAKKALFRGGKSALASFSAL